MSMNSVGCVLVSSIRLRTERAHEKRPRDRHWLLGRGSGRNRLDRFCERNLDAKRRVIREQSRAAREAEVAHQKGCRRRGASAETLEPDADLDERGRERKLRL